MKTFTDDVQTLHEFDGKTVKHVRFYNDFHGYPTVEIVFADNATLIVAESGQAGSVAVSKGDDVLAT